MCGIVGYVGSRNCQEVLLEGLSRLEYRGYDSAGIALVADSGQLQMRKKAGKLQILRDSLEEFPLSIAHTGVGHTRWATHGTPTDRNAHPHLADEGRLALIHNGIIENFLSLKTELLEEGLEFNSDTDSEVVAHLIAKAYNQVHDLELAMRQVAARLEGAFTLLAVHRDAPGLVVGARLNAPLVIGLGEGENFLGSDAAAFVNYTRKALAVGQRQIAVVSAEQVKLTDFAGNPVSPEYFELTWDAKQAEKGGYKWFMEKEIYEIPSSLTNTLRGRIRADGSINLPGLNELTDDYFNGINRILLIGCGTAHYATLTGAYAFESFTGLPVTCELAHEFRYRKPVLDEHTLVVSLSQSGETMDVLMAVRYAISRGAKTLSICNTQGATIARESDAVVYTHAGPEVAVASTKAFVCQVAAIYLLALHIAKIRRTLPSNEISTHSQELQSLADKIKQILQLHPHIQQLAHWMSDSRSVLFLGRHVSYPIALEGALKLKEIAYIHAEGFAAGELKHGPIALIEPGQPVFVMVPSLIHSPKLHGKVISNIQEIRARGARVLAICEADDDSVTPFADEIFALPTTSKWCLPMLQVIPLQFFALELAEAKGLDVDQPRNLAKSVTVE